MKIFPLWFLLYQADKPTDGQRGITKLVVDFDNWYGTRLKATHMNVYFVGIGSNSPLQSTIALNTLHYKGIMHKHYFSLLLIQNID
jgi:hypothetical protein